MLDPQPNKRDELPRVTLVLCSRNDQWQGNSLWRLETALNYTAAQAASIGRLDEVEIIVADWGSAIPIREAAKLTPEAARITRYLNIPTSLAKEKQRDSPFAEVYAINAAVRRSRGEYIGRIDQDTLVGKSFFQWFFSTIDLATPSFQMSKTAMISNRRRIPYDFAVRCLSFPIVEKYVDLFHPFLPQMPQPERYWECYIGILLLHRDLWWAARGYDETFIYYGRMEFDLFLRLLKEFQGTDIGRAVRHDFYHLDHVPYWSVWRSLKRSANPARTPEDPPPVFCPNDESWGLGDYDLPLLPQPHEALLPKTATEWRSLWASSLVYNTALSTIITPTRIAGNKIKWLIGRLLGQEA